MCIIRRRGIQSIPEMPEKHWAAIDEPPRRIIEEVEEAMGADEKI
jgi:hypothetical protein